MSCTSEVRATGDENLCHYAWKVFERRPTAYLAQHSTRLMQACDFVLRIVQHRNSKCRCNDNCLLYARLQSCGKDLSMCYSSHPRTTWRSPNAAKIPPENLEWCKFFRLHYRSACSIAMPSCHYYVIPQKIMSCSYAPHLALLVKLTACYCGS